MERGIMLYVHDAEGERADGDEEACGGDDGGGTVKQVVWVPQHRDSAPVKSLVQRGAWRSTLADD
jgi:hypothetical protein